MGMEQNVRWMTPANRATIVCKTVSCSDLIRMMTSVESRSLFQWFLTRYFDN